MEVEKFFPTDLEGCIYFRSGIYAQALMSDDKGGQVHTPNPCRKVHISSALKSAKTIADAVLPLLRDMKLSHKVVWDAAELRSQSDGDQAGKFITLYMSCDVTRSNRQLREINELLNALVASHRIQPSPRVPRSRTYQHVFMERPLDSNMFLYGGMECTDCH